MYVEHQRIQSIYIQNISRILVDTEYIYIQNISRILADTEHLYLKYIQDTSGYSVYIYLEYIQDTSAYRVSISKIYLYLGYQRIQSIYIQNISRILADTEHEYLYLEWKNRSSLHSQNIATILHPGKPTDIKYVYLSNLTGKKNLLFSSKSGETGTFQMRLSGDKGIESFPQTQIFKPLYLFNLLA